MVVFHADQLQPAALPTEHDLIEMLPRATFNALKKLVEIIYQT